MWGALTVGLGSSHVRSSHSGSRSSHVRSSHSGSPKMRGIYIKVKLQQQAEIASYKLSTSQQGSCPSPQCQGKHNSWEQVILLDNPNPLKHSTSPTLVPQVCLLDHSDLSQLVVTPSLPHHAHSGAAVLPGSVYCSKVHVCPVNVLIKDSNAKGGGTVYSLEGCWSAEKERGRGREKIL